MIYSKNIEYKVKFYRDIETGRSPVLEYIEELRDKEKAKIFKYIEFLRAHKGYLEEPYSKHIKGKVRELRVDFSQNKHRIFYFTFIKKNIILLHAFLKQTSKTPISEIKKAEENYYNVLRNQKNMNKRKKIQKAVDFQKYLAEKLKDPKFKKYYDEYGKRLEIAYQILKLRKQKRISQVELAKKIGTKQSDIARMETGQQNLTTDTLQRIAKALKRDLKIEFVK